MRRRGCEVGSRSRAALPSLVALSRAQPPWWRQAAAPLPPAGSPAPHLGGLTLPPPPSRPHPMQRAHAAAAARPRAARQEQKEACTRRDQVRARGARRFRGAHGGGAGGLPHPHRRTRPRLRPHLRRPGRSPHVMHLVLPAPGQRQRQQRLSCQLGHVEQQRVLLASLKSIQTKPAISAINRPTAVRIQVETIPVRSRHPPDTYGSARRTSDERPLSRGAHGPPPWTRGGGMMRVSGGNSPPRLAPPPPPPSKSPHR